MKKTITLIFLALTITSCNKKEVTALAFTDITFKVLSDVNHPSRLTMGIYEEVSNISIEEVENVTVLPFSKTFSEQIHFSVNIVYKYKDNTAAASFNQYNVVLQILKNDTVVKEQNITVIGAGKETTITTTITN